MVRSRRRLRSRIADSDGHARRANRFRDFRCRRSGRPRNRDGRRHAQFSGRPPARFAAAAHSRNRPHRRRHGPQQLPHPGRRPFRPGAADRGRHPERHGPAPVQYQQPAGQRFLGLLPEQRAVAAVQPDPDPAEHEFHRRSLFGGRPRRRPHRRGPQWRAFHPVPGVAGHPDHDPRSEPSRSSRATR